ncbi:MAG: N-acetylmuramoyl-L-alanine amidase [Bacteroidales bacterium]|jgi:N-acetyl-anhydromuramyl-L-alanine amidase AmpD|nr:N-acetylmuramoyl-L-alanine amidase [Bacteroidales bacterium]MDD4214334.1 N-acetylmuramoyl-L-alanine amidase [Bacteroidales bacterium]
MKKFIFFLLFLSSMYLAAQQKDDNYPYREFFEEAYQKFPEIPRGALEAIAYTNTHIRHINPLTEEISCTGMPGFYGVMGLVLDGKGWFRENLKTVAYLSGYNLNDIIIEPRSNILAYAAAFDNVLSQQKSNGDVALKISRALIHLSELNIEGLSGISDYTMNLYIYAIFRFLNEKSNQQQYLFPEYTINLKEFFGEENLNIFSSKRVNISKEKAVDEEGNVYVPVFLSGPCPDYNQPNCTWIESPNHYTGWNGYTVSAIAIHTVQGSYTSCINWFQNPDANASTHYVVASNSSYAGQVTQMVNENNAAWHVLSENWYAIGYEHEGWIDDPTWYTPLMYQTSAALTRDVCNDHNINPLRTFCRETLDDGTQLDNGLHPLGGETACVKIKGHQHFYNQLHTDPGPNWDWEYYYKLINNSTPVTTLISASGNFYDSGGSSGNYGDDERLFWLIQPPGALSVTLTFSQFNVEADYDFLYVYDGPNEFAPLIGRYNTISPTTISSTGGSLFIEFRSDCATTASGWVANWTSTQTDTENPSTNISALPPWVNSDFTATFNDTDNPGGSGVSDKYYQVIDFNGANWYANVQNGFFNDNFDTALNADWDIADSLGIWNVSNGYLNQIYTGPDKTRLSAYVSQDSNHTWLYHWQMAFNAGSNRRAGIYIMCSDFAQSYLGNAYMIWFRTDDDACQLYTVKDSIISSNLTNDPCTINDGVWYDYKVTYEPLTGILKAYQNNVMISTFTDPLPLHTGIGVSYRTGNASVMFDDLKVYKSRDVSILTKVGPANTKDVRYQSPDNATESCRINSVVIDETNNWSAVASANVRVDWTSPETEVNALPLWQTSDFTATFSDNDVLSGFETGYYQVIENQNGIWGTNASRGFFADNFDVLDTINIWNIPVSSGIWSLSSGLLQQTDEGVYNSNFYTPLNQNLSDKYLYHFKAKAEGSGTNRRFGFHYFCDSASLSNRGNSYFVWFRLEYQTLEFFKVINNSFSSAKKIISNVKTIPGQWYDFKIIFDRTSGKTDVYRNDTLLGSWTDSTPHTNGKYISFRSGNSKLSVDEIKVYRSRSNAVNITVGSSSDNDIRYENQDPGTFSAKIKSIVVDSASNISPIYYYYLNVDFSPPLTVLVSDGNDADIDTTFIPNTLSAHWSASSDSNSEVVKYWYAIGTTPGATDVLGWTDNGINLSFTQTGLVLNDCQVYYIAIKAENGAGLFSETAVSDGQLYLISTVIDKNKDNIFFTLAPNPFKKETYVSFLIPSAENIKISLHERSGRLVGILHNGPMTAGHHKLVLNKEKMKLVRGMYFLNFVSSGKNLTTKIIIL